MAVEKENYKRVTEVLYPFSGLDKIDPEMVRKAGERGTKVHKICESIIAGMGEIGVEDDTRGYVESFKKWWGEGHNVEIMEKRFYDDELQLSGQVDMIIRKNEGLIITDLKTSSKFSKTWEAQGCAYAYLATKAGLNIKGIEFIHLSKKGDNPKIYRFEVNDYFFLAIYRVYCHFYT